MTVLEYLLALYFGGLASFSWAMFWLVYSEGPSPAEWVSYPKKSLLVSFVLFSMVILWPLSIPPTMASISKGNEYRSIE